MLLRGVAPLEGLEIMRERRGRDPRGGSDRSLADGPGKLCEALGITRALDRMPMPGSEVVVVEDARVLEHELRITPRIGITKAAELPLRFVALGPSVNGGG